MITVTFRSDRLVAILDDKPAIPDGDGHVDGESIMTAIGWFEKTHTVLYKDKRVATLVPYQ
jgi:hypothetical protein